MATILWPTLAGRITLLLVPLFLHIPAYSLDPTSNCPASNCGNVSISYPFWVFPPNSSNAETFCGYRNLNITCDSNMPAIGTLLGNYTIKSLNERARALTILHPDAAVTGHRCSPVKRNFTLQAAGIRFLEYTTKVVNLTFFYNCWGGNKLKIHVPGEYQIRCNGENTNHIPNEHRTGGTTHLHGRNDDNQSYVFIDTAVNPTYTKLYSKCEKAMVAPVMQSAVDGKNLSQAFASALQGGFELTWDISGVGSCKSCEFSGGRCGGNSWTDVDDDQLCLCEDYTAERNYCSRPVAGEEDDAREGV